MIKCPNCGSTAQFKISTPMYFEDEVWKQQKKCGCGCVVVLRYTEEIDKIEYPKEADDASHLTHLTHSIIKALNKKKENKQAFYFKFVAETPYCGTENTEYHKFETRPTDEELNEMAEEFGQLNAENYEYLVTGWDNEDEEVEALEYYYADCTNRWEEITEEEYNEEK